MKKFELETVKAQVKDEGKALKDLETAYKQAKKDVQERLRQLNARIDTGDPNIQTVIYQKKYQEILLKQIDDVLNDLQTHTYNSANDFFQNSYRNGYIGSMYELHQQGIPITVPVNPDRMQKAIQTDSKISKNYYLKKGLTVQNIRTLKKQIALEATRGIASGKSWLEVAESLALQKRFQIDLSDAMRIVRTEGNRINQTGRLDAGDEAVKRGCDLLKQWDATLDSATRPAHREADGQIVEWDEDFTVDGEKLKAPCVGGSASNVINCRCQLLKRPRWALDDEELETLKKRAEYYGLDKTKSFEDFKEKFLQLPDIKEQTKEIESVSEVDEIRKQIADTKIDLSAKQRLVDDVQEEQNKLKDYKKNKWRYNGKDKIEAGLERVINYNRPTLYKDDIEMYRWVLDNLDGLEDGSFEKALKQRLSSAKKELKGVQKIIDGLYDELEKHIGTPVMSENLVKRFGSDVIKEARHYLDDADDAYRKLWNKYASNFRTLDSKGGRCYYSPTFDAVALSKKHVLTGGGYQAPFEVFFHEFGHNMDYVITHGAGKKDPYALHSYYEREKGYYSNEFGGEGSFLDLLKKDVDNALDEFAKTLNPTQTMSRGQALLQTDSLIRRGLLKESEKIDHVKYLMSKPAFTRQEIEEKFCEHIKSNYSSVERSDISDMFEPHVSIGYPFGYGHGRNYWSNNNKKTTEAFAEMYSCKLTNPEGWKVIQKYFPNATKYFEKMIEEASK